MITAFGTIYREQVATSREREARTELEAHRKRSELMIFQRESLLSLQDAIVATVKSVYDEQDRMLHVRAETGRWRARGWETPTAQGWADAQFRLQSSRARIFDEEIRNVTGEIRTVARSSIWAVTIEDAKEANLTLADSIERFNELVADRLRELY